MNSTTKDSKKDNYIKCDFCDKPAIYDGKTIHGPWAYLCHNHFNQYGVLIKGLYTILGDKK